MNPANDPTLQHRDPSTSTIGGSVTAAPLSAPAVVPSPYVPPATVLPEGSVIPGTDKGVITKVAPPAVVTSEAAKDMVNGITQTFDSVDRRIADTMNAQKVIEQGAEVAYDEYKSKLASIANGTIPMSPSDQNLISGIQTKYENLKAKQAQLNRAYESGLTVAGIRAGRNRYAPEVEAANIQSAIESGIDRIADIDNEASIKISEARSAIADRNFKAAKEAYDGYKELSKAKMDSVREINDLTIKAQTLLNSSKTNDIKEYEYAKSQGFRGSFQAFVAAQRNLGKAGGSGKIDLNTLIALGMPASMVNSSYADIYGTLTSSEAPSWFSESIISKFPNSTLDPQYIQTLWNQYKQDEEVQATVDLLGSKATPTNSKSSSSSDGGLF